MKGSAVACSLVVLSTLASEDLARTTASIASESPPATTIAQQNYVVYQSGPYCGLYCVYSAARLLSLECKLDDVLQTEFVGNPKGSSLEELCHAAEATGLYAYPIAGGTVSWLSKQTLPMILFVKRDPLLSRDFDHYVLYTKSEESRFTVVDPPEHVTTLSASALSQRWSGDGILLSTTPLNESAIPGHWSLGSVAVFVIVATILMVLLLFRGRAFLAVRKRDSDTFSYTLCKAIILLLASAGGGIIFNALSPLGLFAAEAPTKGIVEAFFPAEVREIDKNEARELLSQNASVFVDARYTPDYEAGHIAGAINVPIDIPDSRVLQLLMRSVDKTSRIVIYCQSRTCPFASVTAQRLMLHAGYHNVYIYKGGWKEWSADSDHDRT